MELNVTKLLMIAGGVMTGLGLMYLMSHTGKGPAVRIFDIGITLVGSVLLLIAYKRHRDE